ncbi:MAG: DUF4430 domain-containing protein [Ruminococcaceae bacterium]|nr:DUF4430 domain-containing protein [Oscillospiraceae bacterium]
MKTRRLLTAMLSAAALCAVAVTAMAEDTPEGYVTFYADKTVLGQGLVVEPVSVPYYEGDNGFDVVQRAADALVADGDWGSYIEGFADADTGAEIPAEIAAVCPEMWGRNTEGYLCAYDYTAESGWSWFLNDEYASVGIGDYVPADGDVIQFRFTVYGYGCDLGVDNTSWGGNPALVEAVQTAELAELAAAADTASDEYVAAIKTLGTFGVSQAEIDAACEAFAAEPAPDADAADDAVSTSPDTGAEGVAALIGVTALAGMALYVSKKR